MATWSRCLTRCIDGADAVLILGIADMLGGAVRWIWTIRHMSRISGRK